MTPVQEANDDNLVVLFELLDNNGMLSVLISIDEAILVSTHKIHFYDIQSNFNGSNIFGTIENCSRHG